MFQFDLWDLSTRHGPGQVLAELAPQMDGWALAAWFARPNGWLQAQRPADVLAAQPSGLPAVLAAARADRLVALG